jgi:hypothetical protein
MRYVTYNDRFPIVVRKFTSNNLETQAQVWRMLEVARLLFKCVR